MLLQIEEHPFTNARRYCVFRDNKHIRTISQGQCVYGSIFSLYYHNDLSLSSEAVCTHKLPINSSNMIDESDDEYNFSDDAGEEKIIYTMVQKKTNSLSYESAIFDSSTKCLAKISKEAIFSSPKFIVQFRDLRLQIIGDLLCTEFRILRGKSCIATFKRNSPMTSRGGCTFILDISVEDQLDLCLIYVMAVIDALKISSNL